MSTPPKVEHTSRGTYTITWTPKEWRVWKASMQDLYRARGAWGLFVEVNGECYCGAKLTGDTEAWVREHIAHSQRTTEAKR